MRLLLGLCAVLALSAVARAETDRDTIDRLRVDLGKDMIDVEGDPEAVRRDRAVLRSAKDALDETVDTYGKNSRQAFRAQARLERAQVALHRDLGDLDPPLRDLSKDRKALSALAKNSQLQTLAQAYGVPPQELSDLRGKGLSWGDIGHALALAKTTGQPLETLVASHRTGKSWGELAADNHVDPATIDTQSRSIEKIGRSVESGELQARNASRRASRRERGARGGHGRSARRR